MAAISILEAVSLAKRDFLPIRGVVGVGYVGNTIIIYIETPETAALIPKSYYGYPVTFKVTGPITTKS
ncbi:MAG: hypothetical protein QXX41_05740 [Nitrososphaerota archaeon]